MPDTLLNPDAVEHTIKEVYGDGPRMDWPSDMTGYQTHRDYARSVVEQVVSAYLAVAQPVVNSVEELDALPYGSLITGSSGVTVMKYDGPNYDWITGNDYRYRMDEQEQCLPARVLYRPEVKP